jgi:serine/threonine protein kinase
MGEVYRALDPKLQREVAIKVLPEALASDPPALARFEREARAVAALSHPHILAIHDFGVADGTAYAVMELLEGETLRAKLGGGPLPARKAAEYGAQLADGLVAAHDKGIVHRDLKPENVFVTNDGRVKILDFGLALQGPSLVDGDESHSPTRSRHTDPGTVLGTVGYMSPEQVRGRSVDHRSDIFSFGAILFEMVTGTRAFRRDSSVETMNAILKEDPLDAPVASGAVPPALERILRDCLEKAPDERFQSARDLAFDLATPTGATTSGRAPVATASPWRKPWILFGTAALLMAGPNGRAVPRTPHRPHERPGRRLGATVYSGYAPHSLHRAEHRRRHLGDDAAVTGTHRRATFTCAMRTRHPNPEPARAPPERRGDPEVAAEDAVLQTLGLTNGDQSRSRGTRRDEGDRAAVRPSQPTSGRRYRRRTRGPSRT